MTRFLPLALAAVLCAVPGVRAQTPKETDVYKIVGPDGHVTFSDRVPTGQGVRASLVNHPAASQPVVMLPAITAITPWPALSMDARRGIVPAVPLGQTLDSPGAITLELVDALSLALARAEIVQVMREQCLRVRMGTGGVYDDLARRWQERNGTVVDRANVILLAAFDPARRAKLQSNAHTRVVGILTPLASAGSDAKVQWCEQSGDAVGHGALDLDGGSSPIGKTLKDFVIH